MYGNWAHYKEKVDYTWEEAFWQAEAGEKGTQERTNSLNQCGKKEKFRVGPRNSKPVAQFGWK